MCRTGLRSPSIRLRRVSSHVRVRFQPVQVESTFDFSNIIGDQTKQLDYGVEPGEVVGRRIMIVVDSSLEAKCALQWVLSHGVQSQDTIILLYVINSKQGKKSSRNTSRRVYELHSMKNTCLMKRPEVRVEIALVEGKEKAPIIVEEVNKQGASLLVLGQRKRSIMWHAVMMWRRNRTGASVVEYCIENANCMTVAVREKSRTGGYLITTRHHKDFWQLA
ncbi:hypothetical protein IFM89_011432 [Coptis chinensis]|uniref:UspA domain-containing protein n=1 Tax=Coptis chinensis TaxID=261450 RepID=A0A835IVG2_9MAGN|nr:hypothetical protein IFM89_011432 [Coptis chinensis]